MTKSYFFLVLVLTLVLAKNCSAEVLPGADADHGDDSGEQFEPEPESEFKSNSKGKSEADAPAMNCLLFGDTGCHIACTVLSQVYGVEAEGNCKKNQTCHCLVYGEVSFHERWNKLFDADYVYSKIIEDQNKEYMAEAIFNNPFRTAEEFKQLFKPIVSPYQFSKLKVHDDSMAAKFTEKSQGKVDEDAVKKYVSEKIGELMKSNDYESVLNMKYKERFTKFLTECGSEKRSLYNIAFRIRQSKNKVLDQLLKEYLMKNELEEPQVDAIYNENLPTTILNTVDNEIIRMNNEKNEAPSAKKKTTPRKKRVRRTVRKSKPAAKSD